MAIRQGVSALCCIAHSTHFDPMLKPLVLLLGGHLLIACYPTSIFPHPTATTAPTPMTNSTGITIANITLQAREEPWPPAGGVPQPDREIGFAALFCQIENHQLADQAITIDRIEIQDATSGHIYLQTATAQTIRLRPLEHAASDFHLTNQTGFGRATQLQAVLTYTLAGRQATLISAPIDLDRS
jgi:hypothetical protein